MFSVSCDFLWPLLLLRGVRILKNRLAEVIVQAAQVLVILLTNVLLQLLSGAPRYIPCESPGPRVRAGIINGSLKMQCAFVGPSDSLDDVKLIRVRVSGSIQPGSFIETNCVHNQSVTFPVTHGMA